MVFRPNVAAYEGDKKAAFVRRDFRESSLKFFNFASREIEKNFALFQFSAKIEKGTFGDQKVPYRHFLTRRKCPKGHLRLNYGHKLALKGRFGHTMGQF